MTSTGGSGNFVAELFPVAANGELRVESFVPARKPGNVAVCLSGGGSRALTAGMGQLRALELLTTADGTSLLAQTKAISTVSGGSWLGVPFTFLTPGTTDADYLGGPYIPPADLTLDGIAMLPVGTVAGNATADFTLEYLALLALVLWWDGVPADMLWQTLISDHFLAPYGLFEPVGDAESPHAYFTQDETTRARIVELNPSLANAPVHEVGTAGRTRPFLLCNISMAVNGGADLAPVQATPFFTGIAGTAHAVDANGRAIGGGGVTSFAFNSQPAAVYGGPPPLVAVREDRPWSLVDIVGTSSAAFAEEIVSTFRSWVLRPDKLAAAIHLHAHDVATDAARITGSEHERLSALLASAASGGLFLWWEIILAIGAVLTEILAAIEGAEAIVPAYRYWPVKDVSTAPVSPTQFADAGSLENCAVASMLSYSDIDALLVFDNTMEPLGVDPLTGFFFIDEAIPPLFGYQPYQPLKARAPYADPCGYVRYQSADPEPEYLAYRHNQVFPYDAFPVLLAGLQKASNSYQNSPVFSQPLVTVENDWFGVKGGKSVTVVWSYLENALSWGQQLSQVGDEGVSVASTYSALVQVMEFPHYSTFETELSAQEINLLAGLTSWSVVTNSELFTSLYVTAPATG